jgi:tRNA modification GTPase
MRLLDTAGIAIPTDPVEAEGMRRSRRAMEESDLVLLVVDGSIAAPEEPVPATADHRRIVVVRSKADLPRHPGARIPEGAVDVSSVTGAGIPALVERIAAEVAARVGVEGDEGQVAASLRQIERLEAVSRALGAARAALGALPLEAALVDLREALTGISDLLGLDVGDAVLDRIFSTFCVGK